jgi:hypothetical protein
MLTVPISAFLGVGDLESIVDEDRPDLTPNAVGVLPPPIPPYFVIAAGV